MHRTVTAVRSLRSKARPAPVLAPWLFNGGHWSRCLLVAARSSHTTAHIAPCPWVCRSRPSAAPPVTSRSAHASRSRRPLRYAPGRLDREAAVGRGRPECGFAEIKVAPSSPRSKERAGQEPRHPCFVPAVFRIFRRRQNGLRPAGGKARPWRAEGRATAGRGSQADRRRMSAEGDRKGKVAVGPGRRKRMAPGFATPKRPGRGKRGLIHEEPGNAG